MRWCTVSDDGPLLADRAGRLRQEFDRSFAVPPPTDPQSGVDLLGIRLGGETYALRLSEVAGLFSERKVTRLPSGHTGLLGIAGFRGAIVPVYDLAALMGHAPEQSARWLVIADAAPVAFAFAALDGHVRVDRDAIVVREGGDQARRHVTDFAHTPALVRAIVSLPSLVGSLRDQIKDM
jgi:purine-binding chemotaxis protein CheW